MKKVCSNLAVIPSAVAKQSRIAHLRRDKRDSALGPAKPTIPLYLDWLQRQCANIDVLGLRSKEGRSLWLNNVHVPLTNYATGTRVTAVVARPA